MTRHRRAPARLRPGWRLRVACACLLAACAAPVAALQLRLQEEGLTPAARDASTALLRDAVAALPPGFSATLPAQVEVRWSDQLPPHTSGRARRDVVLLNRALLAPLLGASGATDAPADASPATGPATRTLLLATVVHELAHLHDRRSGLSEDPRLLDLAGWQVRARRLGLRQRANHFSDRSPDPYELSDPREFVAVNLEHFLLDPEYACRRPALHRFFRRQLGPGAAPASCPTGLPFLNAGLEAAAPAVEIIDPDRVHGVDFLFAEGNEQLMSRWGHSMLRLVVCAPGRPLGPDCRLDLQHHRVLSFRAFVDDVQLSSWRGLTGSYPSRLFVLPLEQVVEEYTRTELRGLQSIPLQLQRDEIAALVERSAQLHWSYDGDYYFLSNNCAVETFKLLHDGVPRLADEGLAAITPTGLLAKLERRGIADATVLGDPAEALRLGYRFDSQREHFQLLYDQARAATALAPPRVEDWMALPAAERAEWLQRVGLRDGAALLLLEQAIVRRQVLAARDDLKRRYLGAAGSGEFAAAAGHLRGILQGSGVFSRPALLLAGSGGYGIPQPDELQRVEAGADGHRHRLRALREGLADAVTPLLDPALAAELDRTRANVDHLATRLRTLHRDAGGLVLP